jgi:hypothetical protein
VRGGEQAPTCRPLDSNRAATRWRSRPSLTTALASSVCPPLDLFCQLYCQKCVCLFGSWVCRPFFLIVFVSCTARNVLSLSRSCVCLPPFVTCVCQLHYQGIGMLTVLPENCVCRLGSSEFPPSRHQKCQGYFQKVSAELPGQNKRRKGWKHLPVGPDREFSVGCNSSS